jgi:hypothetical protein
MKIRASKGDESLRRLIFAALLAWLAGNPGFMHLHEMFTIVIEKPLDWMHSYAIMNEFNRIPLFPLAFGWLSERVY